MHLITKVLVALAVGAVTVIGTSFLMQPQLSTAEVPVEDLAGLNAVAQAGPCVLYRYQYGVEVIYIATGPGTIDCSIASR